MQQLETSQVDWYTRLVEPLSEQDNKIMEIRNEDTTIKIFESTYED